MEPRTRSRLWTWLGVVLVMLLVGCGVVVYIVGRGVAKVADALSTDTKVAVRPNTAGGRLELDLTYGKEVTNLSTVTVTDAAGTKLWEATVSGKPAKIVYGQLPAEGGTQVFPEGGKPPADVRGKTVTVVVNNRFQVALGPGHELTEVTVAVPE